MSGEPGLRVVMKAEEDDLSLSTVVELLSQLALGTDAVAVGSSAEGRRRFLRAGQNWDRSPYRRADVDIGNPEIVVRDLRVGSVEVVLAAVGSSALALPALAKFLTFARDWTLDQDMKRAALRKAQADAEMAEGEARRQKFAEDESELKEQVDELNEELEREGVVGARIDADRLTEEWPFDLAASIERIGRSIGVVEVVASSESQSPDAEGPGWRPDPTGRFDHRYWDGNGWTEHVSRRGVALTDYTSEPTEPTG